MSGLRLRSVLLLGVAACGLAGCEDTAPNPADLTLKPGFYALTRREPDSRAQRFDILLLNETQAKAWPDTYLKTLQDRLKPPRGGSGAYNANDYPCRIGDVRQQGNSFTARGTCHILSRGEATDFVYSGIRTNERFKITVKMNPRKPGQDGKPAPAKDIEIAGMWVKADDDKPSGM